MNIVNRMIKYNIFVLLISCQVLLAQFKAPAKSPLALGEHPRLLLTQKNLPELRQRIQRYYRSDFQKFLHHMNRLFHLRPGSEGLSEYNDLFGAARSFAFLALIDAAAMPPASGILPREQYAQKAIELADYICIKIPDDWNEKHHGASNLATRDGGIGSLALQVVYDWTYPYSTVQQRKRIVDKLIALWENRYNSRKVKLENHFAANVHIYSGALCFYGDKDMGTQRLAKAKEMMDSFHDVFMRRQLQVSETLFEGSSDWIEGDGYAMDSYIGLMLMASVSGPAFSENFFEKYNWLRSAPWWLYFTTNPWPYEKDYYFTQHNTSSLMRINTIQPSSLMSLVAANLVKSDPKASGFAAWFVERSPYGQHLNTFRYYEPHLYDLFYKFLFGTKHVPKLSPQQVGVELSVHLGQGYAFRSSHDPTSATLIQFTAPKFWYDNGHNETEHGAIGIYKFGTLAVPSVHGKSGGKEVPRVRRGSKAMAFNNVLGIGPDKELRLQMGRINKIDEPEDFVDGKVSQIGDVQAVRFERNAFDYVNYDYTKSYKAGDKAKLARRAIVYLRGQTNNEFLVVLDRVKSAYKKYFILHTPGDITAADNRWFPVETGHWVSPARQFSVTNRIAGAHGKMVITSLWPQNIETHKYGGPGREWVFADGSLADYDTGKFGEKAQYFFGNHTLQLRSDDGVFLTVMQIGDANTLQRAARVEPMQGQNWFGAKITEPESLFSVRTKIICKT
ncbi:MAG: hypothetical protein DWQ10_16355 [Calditrichaeota bacterium]|nr:MAG: hypothetical protein DWQ10_16355 [Calditrichota bacterium]